LAGGCAERPRAPALTNDPVYQDDAEGLRFAAPEGWTMHVRSRPAAGPDAHERLLVGYRRVRAERPAQFEVSRADLPESADLVAHLTGGGARKDWRPAKPPEPVEVGGRPGRRISLAGRVGGEALAREVVAVRRGGRVYFFAVTTAPGDAGARDEARRAVASVRWKDG
jgi:hypothetical protein